MHRVEIIRKIDAILDIYDKTANKKELDTQLQQLRGKLTGTKDDRINRLLAKGEDLTFSEIHWLLDQEITRTKIAKAMRMNLTNFVEYLENHGIERVRKERETVSKAKGDVERAKTLLKENDLSCPEIAKRTGVNESTVYYHAKKIRSSNTIDKSDKPKTNVKKEVSEQSVIQRLKKEKEIAENHADELHATVQELLKERKELMRKLEEKEQEQVNSEPLAKVQKKHDLLLDYIQLG
ncbi:hypothetical protein [Gracilibacillus sp. YIM 98692]|uniref:hypothetical protein n=1 Tax=Gracilibacillus sp. YIM 98692 TaxID=2663532 RepID=UPI0013D407B8|nr:hypothetical protein [Gracilibacillus sp. YIM 98692]